MSELRYLDICSGISAPTAAWKPLGWECAAFSEIEKFPRAVLAHHYPEVPLHGDFTTIGNEYGPIDLLVGGTPCQSFSVAGLRGGLADERGNLALAYLRLADRTRPRWLVWENVPGVLSSNGGRDFGTFLGGLAELGYGFAYAVLDAQWFGVPQRRRRVFVVGHLGDWRRAAAVLFERHSLSGHPAPRREAREGFAAPTAPSLTASGRGVERTGESRGQDPVVAVHLATHEVAGTMMSYAKSGGDSNRIDNAAAGYMAITHSLRAEGFDASEDGTGHGTDFDCDGGLVAYGGNRTSGPLDVATACQAHGGPHGRQDFGSETFVLMERGREGGPNLEYRDDGTANAILTPNGGRGGLGVGVMPAVAFDWNNSAGAPNSEDAFGTLSTNRHMAAMQGSAVRRLTPRECERLQGFPDDYTLVPYRGKPAADGPRYKALGNSMAVPVVRWIGERIQLVEALQAESLAA